jgi:hypothetical protein
MKPDNRLTYDELSAVARALTLELEMLRPKYERAKLLAAFPRLSGSLDAFDELPHLAQQLHSGESAARKILLEMQYHKDRPRGRI